MAEAIRGIIQNAGPISIICLIVSRCGDRLHNIYNVDDDPDVPEDDGIESVWRISALNTQPLFRSVSAVAFAVCLLSAAVSQASTIVVDTTAKTLTFTGSPEAGTPLDLFGNGFIEWDLGSTGANSTTIGFQGASSLNGVASSSSNSFVRLDFNASDTALARISISQAYLATIGAGVLSFNPLAFSYAGLNATQQATFESAVLGAPFSVPLEPGSIGFSPVSFTSAAIPEPGTFALASVVALGCLCWRTRRRRKTATPMKEA